MVSGPPSAELKNNSRSDEQLSRFTSAAHLQVLYPANSTRHITERATAILVTVTARITADFLVLQTSAV